MNCAAVGGAYVGCGGMYSSAGSGSGNRSSRAAMIDSPAESFPTVARTTSATSARNFSCALRIQDRISADNAAGSILRTPGPRSIAVGTPVLSTVTLTRPSELDADADTTAIRSCSSPYRRAFCSKSVAYCAKSSAARLGSKPTIVTSHSPNTCRSDPTLSTKPAPRKSQSEPSVSSSGIDAPQIRSVPSGFREAQQRSKTPRCTACAGPLPCLVAVDSLGHQPLGCDAGSVEAGMYGRYSATVRTYV
ncbi:hypothetical protein APR11_003443 [Nocardia amikacinitolerans]|nr:hypothetical protein [Nocardia amikacinitolerans]